MLKYTINKFLELRFEDGNTNIYVNNQLFMHCKYILLKISTENTTNMTKINSIDDAVEKFDRSFEFPRVQGEIRKINPKTLFWAHCSNLQVWFENNYNSSLIHSNLAFPLLKELAKAGDRIAKRVFKEEVAQRFESKNLSVIQFLLYNEYLDYLNKEELEIVLEQTKVNLRNIIINRLNELMKSMISNYQKIKNLIDTMLFIDLKYNKNMIFCILNELNEKIRMDFARFLILHLNYKEFIDYKIAYGKFFIYFEKILDYIHENCPEIKDLLKIIDSGFLSGAIPLDEKFSYGAVPYYGTI